MNPRSLLTQATARHNVADQRGSRDLKIGVNSKFRLSLNACILMWNLFFLFNNVPAIQLQDVTATTAMQKLSDA